MSDGFDKEAEREKLREKFAEDEKKREHTQRMSELLLKGATMTNRHCGECGDPIFRHDGREFCPTCGNEVGDAGEEAAGEAPADEGDASADVKAEDGVDAAAENGAAAGDAVGASEGNSDTVDARTSGAPRSQSPPSGAAPPRTDPRRSEPQRSPPSRSAGDAEGVDAARASLTRTLTRFARAAEETDDPRRARDHLEAAREAAEALAALD